MQTTNQSSQQELSCTKSHPPPPDDSKPKPKQPLHRSAVISTFNIENLYSNNVYLSTLLGTIDIIAIQEHWLFKFEKSKLHEFAENYKFSCFIKSVDENYPISVKHEFAAGVGVLYYGEKSWTNILIALLMEGIGWSALF